MTHCVPLLGILAGVDCGGGRGHKEIDVGGYDGGGVGCGWGVTCWCTGRGSGQYRGRFRMSSECSQRRNRSRKSLLQAGVGYWRGRAGHGDEGGVEWCMLKADLRVLDLCPPVHTRLV